MAACHSELSDRAPLQLPEASSGMGASSSTVSAGTAQTSQLVLSYYVEWCDLSQCVSDYSVLSSSLPPGSIFCPQYCGRGLLDAHFIARDTALAENNT